MKLNIVLYIDNGASDNDLLFQNQFLPEVLAQNLITLDACSDVFISYPESYIGKNRDGKNWIPRATDDGPRFWKDLFSSLGCDHIVKIYADSPFLDVSVIDAMIRLHLEYLAEYTYSENLPEGISCEIISKGLVNGLPDVDGSVMPLSKVIKANINQFDVEIYYKEPDIRDKRISFRSGKPRDKRIMENIAALNGRVPGYEELKGAIEAHPEVLYIGPSYLEIELCGRCDLDCIFCFRNSLPSCHGDMNASLFKKAVSDMRQFEMPYSICLGGSGEPMMHTNFYEILKTAFADDLVSSIVIETNGIYADNSYKNFLLGQKNKKIKTIVNINGFDQETYLSIHGKDFFTTVFNNVISLRELNEQGDMVYVQIMKINETEPFLDRYYDFWEKQKVPIILQKQNTFLGKIPDRRYSDLSPLDRIPCWHLQRDIYVLSDGRIGFCKQDITGDQSTGDLSKESIKDVFLSRRDSFIQDYKKIFPSLPDCRSCDEWYTFNL